MHKTKFKWMTAVVVVLYFVCIAFFYKLPFSTSVFQDVPDSYWASYDIQFMYDHGLMKGRDNTVWNFYPDKTMTRAEVLALMLKVNGVNTDKLTAPDKTDFADVPNTHWAAGVVAEAEKMHMVPFKDVTPAHFYPDKPVTRGELAEAVCEALQIPTTGVPDSSFVNLPDIKGTPYEAAIRKIISDKYAQGKDNGLFEPNGTATRAEVASIFHKAIADNRPNLKSPTSTDTNTSKGGGK